MEIISDKFRNFLKELRKKSIEMGIPSLPESSARFLSLLTYLYPEKHPKIIELGAGIGYSVMWMLYGCLSSGKRAKIFAVEKNGDILRESQRILKKIPEILNVDIIEYIEFIKKDSRELEGHEFGENIDIVFMDIEKSEYLSSFLKFKPYMKKGAILIAHNVISHKEELSDFINEINKKDKYFTLFLETDPKGISVTFLK